MSLSTVLVTGATGFLGRRLVDQLIRQGFGVRAFVRKTSDTAKLQAAGADIVSGDVRDADSLKAAMEGVDVVVHAAADTSGNARDGHLVTVMGTKNVLEAAASAGVKQFIYISSCSVYGIFDCQPGQVIDESGPLERFPGKRGAYSMAKFEAEQIVLKAMTEMKMKITCLRPGTIWGPGGETFTPMMGIRVAGCIGIIGTKGFVLPLVYLDNLIDAITHCIDHHRAYNQVFNVVDTWQVNKSTYTDKVLKPLFPEACFFKIPYRALYAIVWMQEIMFRVLRREPYMTRYRLISSQRPVIYSPGKIGRELGWRGKVGFDEAAREVLGSKQ